MSREPTEVELRVAKALCVADGLIWDDQANPMTSGNGGDNKISYLRSARAAILAMRDMTPIVKAFRRMNYAVTQKASGVP